LDDERVRPPYRPEDDEPFRGERWGCFWASVLAGSGIATLLLSTLLVSHRTAHNLLTVIAYLLIGFAIGNYFRLRHRR